MNLPTMKQTDKDWGSNNPDDQFKYMWYSTDHLSDSHHLSRRLVLKVTDTATDTATDTREAITIRTFVVRVR